MYDSLNQAHPYLVANGIGGGPAGYIAPPALASHPSAQAQLGAIQVRSMVIDHSIRGISPRMDGRIDRRTNPLT